MNGKYIVTVIVTTAITAIITMVLTESRHLPAQDHAARTGTPAGEIRSPYAGQEARDIKALSRDDIKGLLTGAGTPFGGMAKPAELNGYPGPRHVLDAIKAGDLKVTEEQKTRSGALYEEMKRQAVPLGEQIIVIEQKINDDFTNRTVTKESLRRNIEESATTYANLRFTHLKYHLQMVDILAPEQVERYNLLRGYLDESDPCDKVPDGHDPDLWKRHNHCE